MDAEHAAELGRLKDERDALRERVAALEAGLRPFAAWYAAYGPDEIAREAVGAYRRAAELLADAG